MPSVTPAQRDAFARAVEDRFVLDLGSGANPKLSVLAMELGAASVVAVDKEPLAVALPYGVTYRQESFANFNRNVSRIDLALVSWPWVTDRSLLYLIEKSDMVLYLGKNTDLVRCGSPKTRIHRDLWRLLSRRPAIAHVPAPGEVLIVYGERTLERPRPLLGEEYAALSETPITYTES